MPSGVAVVDAFRNLIRHGKNHHAASKAQSVEATPNTSPSTDYSSRSTRSSQPATKHQAAPAQQQPVSAAAAAPAAAAAAQPQPMKKEQVKEQAVAQNVPVTNAGAKGADYAREVQAIVQEEREAKSKMPTYKGLENYKLLDKMGDGAFSNVYKALDLTTRQKVAIKVVRKYELSASQDGERHLNPQFKKKPRVTERANILKEVQIMRAISHPGIVRLLHFSESSEFYFLVLELCEGGELFHQIVKLTYFSENLARHVILQVAQGIRYLHEEAGVVHRDIKPENLLFERIPIIPSKQPIQRPYDEEKEDEGEFIPGVGGGGIGRVKIADFGLSKVIWDEQTMTPCGTVGYTAPEIVKDERYSKSVDMWALGCVLYTLLCGFPPFYDESINVLTEKVARGHYTFLSPWWDDISATAKDLITHLLCVDPNQRYTIDEFLAHPWCNAAPAPPPPPTPMAHPLDSPLLHDHFRRGGRDGRSPGVATLKEAFDITYAVHRMEEEGPRRKAVGAGGRGPLGELNEDDEEMDEDTIEDARRRRGEEPSNSSGHRKTASGASAASASSARSRGRTVEPSRNTQRTLDAGRAGQRDRGRHQPFELDLDGATLLGRRHKRGVQPLESSPLARAPVQQAPDIVDAPQSPMRM